MAATSRAGASRAARIGRKHIEEGHRAVIGCFIAGLLIILLFAVVPFPLWPLLVVGLVILLVIAAALGLLKGILGAIFGRH